MSDANPQSFNYKPSEKDESRTVSFPAVERSRSRLSMTIRVFFRRIWSAVTLSEEPDAGLCRWFMDENKRLRNQLAKSEARADAADAAKKGAELSADALAMAYTSLQANLTSQAGGFTRQTRLLNSQPDEDRE